MTAGDRDPAAHVRAFVREKGALLLDLLGEVALDEEPWRVHSHGAWRRVHSDAGHLFERRVLVLVRPEGDDPGAFSTWAMGRLDRLGKYGELCNLGRLVRTLPRERTVTGVLMWRLGDDPMSPQAEFPSADHMPAFFAGFARNVERYVKLFGDAELRYVRALRIYRVPRRGRPDERVLGLDPLPTAIGGAEAPVPIAALSLVRGVLGELVEVVEQRREELLVGRGGLGRGWLATRLRAGRLRAVTDGLYGVMSAVDEARLPDLASARVALAEISMPPSPARRALWALAVAVGVGALALALTR